MKLFIPIFLLFYIDAYSQVLTGKVYDSISGNPVVGANVYLNGSSYFTTTTDSGVFQEKKN